MELFSSSSLNLFFNKLKGTDKSFSFIFAASSIVVGMWFARPFTTVAQRLIVGLCYSLLIAFINAFVAFAGCSAAFSFINR